MIPVIVLVPQTVLTIPILLRPFKLLWLTKYFSKKDFDLHLHCKCLFILAFVQIFYSQNLSLHLKFEVGII